MSNWEELKEKGNLEYKRQNYNSAIEIYSDAIKMDPDQEQLYANRSLCYKALQNYRQALNDIDKALIANPKSIKNLKRKYEILLITANFAEAENVMQKCCNFEPKEHNHKLDFGKAKNYVKDLNSFHDAYNSENYIKGEEIGAKLIEVCHGNNDFKLAYMDCLIGNNKLNEAISFFQKKLNSNDRGEDEAIYLMCKVFYYEGNYEKSKNTLKKLLGRVNDNQKYNRLYQCVSNIEKEKEVANALFKEGKYNEAINAYTKLMEFDPKNKIFNSTIIANRALCK